MEGVVEKCPADFPPTPSPRIDRVDAPVWFEAIKGGHRTDDTGQPRSTPHSEPSVS